jgi:aryl-alcohol dehydrogenase-like predicted oxidoreductase
VPGFGPRTLGRTGLRVSPIGIGGGSQMGPDDLLYAFDRGVNYFFFSSDLHHFAYQTGVEALRRLCGAGSSVRDRVVLATVSYVNDPEKILGVLYDQFTELGVDYIDVFHWGWINDRTDCDALFEASVDVRDGGPTRDRLNFILNRRAQAEAVNADLSRRGLVRFVGASFHSRAKARQWVNGPLDVLMLRYNIAHLGIENDVLPFLSGRKDEDPGIVAFNVAHEGIHYFNVRPPGYPPDYPVPSVPACYRFALSNPSVDLVLTGVKDRAELDAALRAVEQGPLTPTEAAFMRKYGLIRTNRAQVRARPPVSRVPPAAPL